jgi:hypothetical protein
VSIFGDGSIVVEVGGIELGQGLWTKVKQATIYGLRALCPANTKASESLNVRVVQADIISLPHGGITADSTSSEGSCEAVRRACQVLVDRIMPLKLQKEQASANGYVSWHDLIISVCLAILEWRNMLFLFICLFVPSDQDLSCIDLLVAVPVKHWVPRTVVESSSKQKKLYLKMKQKSFICFFSMDLVL